jgi:hypothetical protein
MKVISQQNRHHNHYKNFWEELIGQSGKLPVQSNLISGPVGTRDHICVLSRTSTYFEMGPPFRREKGSDYHCSLPLYWGRLERAFTH